jgi:glutathione S-transferase
MTDTALLLIGRSSSHFTRVARIVAAELGLSLDFQPVYDLGSRDRVDYGGSPAMKLPVLRMGDDLVFGAENICRTLADRVEDAGIAWTGASPDVQVRNAQELVWHAMAAQVQLVFGTQACGLPADNAYFAKAADGLRQSLAWLDAHLDEVLDKLPPRRTSLLEVTLFCVWEHLGFRPTIERDGYSRLDRFAQRFGGRPSAQSTSYRFDAPPTA